MLLFFASILTITKKSTRVRLNLFLFSARFGSRELFDVTVLGGRRDSGERRKESRRRL